MNLREVMGGYMMDAQIERQSPGNIQLKQARLGHFVTWCEAQGVTHLEQVTPNVTRAFVIHLQAMKSQELNPIRPTMDRPLSPLTIKGYMRIVQAFFRWCKREDLLGGREEPTARLPKMKIPRYVIPTFSPEQIKSMLDACNLGNPLGFRDYALLLVLADTGIRVSEMCGLTLENVHENYLKVFGKGSKEREVGIGPTASKALWKYIHQYRQASPTERRVFLASGKTPMNRNTVTQLFHRLAKRANVTGVRVSAHTFRHTFARSWLENGGEFFSLSRVLGHSDVQTTQDYLKDFQSREARIDHLQYSPVERLKIGKNKRDKKSEPQ